MVDNNFPIFKVLGADSGIVGFRARKTATNLGPTWPETAPHGAKVNFSSAATCATKTDKSQIRPKDPYEDIHRTEVIVDQFLT